MVKEGLIRFQSDENFQMFEKIRDNKLGGGLVIGALKSLNPIWLNYGGSEAEAFTIQISVKNMKIRLVNAYGPQEYDDFHKKKFFGHF